MADTMKTKGLLKEGLKNCSPPAPSEKVKGPSVDRDAKRQATAPTPKTLGPRHA